MSLAHAETKLDAPLAKPTAAPRLELLNPVALLGQALVSLTGADAAERVAHADLRSPSVIQRAALLVARTEMSVRFANDDYDRVSLLLAESQLRVRLAPDVLLRCELSSRDVENTAAELAFDLGIQFRFK